MENLEAVISVYSADAGINKKKNNLLIKKKLIKKKLEKLDQSTSSTYGSDGNETDDSEKIGKIINSSL